MPKKQLQLQNDLNIPQPVWIRNNKSGCKTACLMGKQNLRLSLLIITQETINLWLMKMKKSKKECSHMYPRI